jgi:predicted acyltransferase (DUF342 family)
MIMKHRLTMTILLLGALLLTGCMSASFSGNYVVQAGDTLRGNLFVTSGSVMLEEGSRVTGTIILTSGALHIGPNAEVGGDVVLTSGALYMAEGSVVHGNVILSSEDIQVQQDPGSTIEGVITYNIVPFATTFIAKGLFLFCVLPLVLIIVLILLLGMLIGRSSKKRSQVVQAPATEQAPVPAPAVTEDAQAKLQQLKSMLDQGLINEADYEAKKADILSKM